MSSKLHKQPKMHAEKRNFSSGNQPLKPKNKKAAAIIVSAVFLAGLSAALLLNRTEITDYINRPVAKVRIENQWQQVSEAEISGVLSKFMTVGFFSLDTNGIKRDLELLPWVEFASVKRVWPDTLSLTLHEEKAIARWGEGAFLNQSGKVFAPDAPSWDSALPLLSGPDGTQLEVMNQYLALSQLLIPEDIRLSELALSERGNWELVLNDHVKVSAGKEQAFENLNRFVSVLVHKQPLNLADIASVDLRYRNGFAIKTLDQEFAGVAAR